MAAMAAATAAAAHQRLSTMVATPAATAAKSQLMSGRAPPETTGRGCRPQLASRSAPPETASGQRWSPTAQDKMRRHACDAVMSREVPEAAPGAPWAMRSRVRARELPRRSLIPYVVRQVAPSKEPSLSSEAGARRPRLPRGRGRFAVLFSCVFCSLSHTTLSRPFLTPFSLTCPVTCLGNVAKRAASA